MSDFGNIYDGNYGKLVRLAVKMLGDSDSAADIVHDVFVHFFTRQNEGHLILFPSSWLYKAVINKCIDLLKRDRKFQAINAADIEKAEEPADGKEHRIAMVQSALTRLTPRERAIMSLYSEGLSYRDIAESAGIRFSSVGKTISRTLEKLETELKSNKYELY